MATDIPNSPKTPKPLGFEYLRLEIMISVFLLVQVVVAENVLHYFFVVAVCAVQGRIWVSPFPQSVKRLFSISNLHLGTAECFEA